MSVWDDMQRQGFNLSQEQKDSITKAYNNAVNKGYRGSLTDSITIHDYDYTKTLSQANNEYYYTILLYIILIVIIITVLYYIAKYIKKRKG
jgi:hypothetical protein